MVRISYLNLSAPPRIRDGAEFFQTVTKKEVLNSKEGYNEEKNNSDSIIFSDVGSSCGLRLIGFKITGVEK